MSRTAVLGRHRRPTYEPSTPVRLRLTTGFELTIGGTPVALARAPQRILAYLALVHHAVDRSTLAGALWLDVPQSQANGSLRSALWRFGQIGQTILVQTDGRLALDAAVRVDLDDLVQVCHRIATGGDPAILESLPKVLACSDILPTWDEEWLVLERERYRQLRLHALERAGEILLARGQYGLAIDVCLSALDSEPLHESAHRLVVNAHLREGNVTEAIRQYRRYKKLLREELGIAPSPRMEALMAHFREGGLR